MSRIYFGTDGIRGTVGAVADHGRLHASAGSCRRPRAQARRVERPTVLIGKDTRISGYMIESALEAGFASAGVHVLLTGPLPTPGVAYLTRALRLSLGVVISASHNPFGDNGIKFFSARGEKLPDAWERAGRGGAGGGAAMGRFAPAWARRAGSTMRAAATSSSARAPFRGDLSLKGLKLVVDARARRGLSGRTERVPRTRGRGDRIGCSPDGLNINDGFGATAPAALVRRCCPTAPTTASRSTATPTGCNSSTRPGACYNGDELLYLMAADRLAQGAARAGRGGHADDQHGGRAGAAAAAASQFVRAKVGDRYVLEELPRAAGNSAARARGT